MRPIRVLMSADTVGGVFTYALELAAGLGPRAEVHLATMGTWPSAPQAAAAAALDNVVLHPSAYRLEWMDTPWEDVEQAGAWLLALEREIGADLVHLNGYAHGALPFDAPVLVVAHSCVVSWFAEVDHCAPPTCFDRYQREVRRGVAAATRVVSPTRAMLDYTRRFHGPLRSSHVIPNGRRALAQPRAPKREIVLSAGRMWDRAKNLETLARAAPSIAWPVYVAGPTTPPDGAHRSRHALTDGVHPLGALSPTALGAWLAEATIYAHPARYEPFGLGPLEAAQAGCALVLGDIPTLREVWGDAACFVPPGDAAGLADEINALIGRPREREERAVAARERAARYSCEAMGDAYFEGYMAMIREGRTRCAS